MVTSTKEMNPNLDTAYLVRDGWVGGFLLLVIGVCKLDRFKMESRSRWSVNSDLSETTWERWEIVVKSSSRWHSWLSLLFSMILMRSWPHWPRPMCGLAGAMIGGTSWTKFARVASTTVDYELRVLTKTFIVRFLGFCDRSLCRRTRSWVMHVRGSPASHESYGFRGPHGCHGSLDPSGPLGVPTSRPCVSLKLQACPS